MSKLCGQACGRKPKYLQLVKGLYPKRPLPEDQMIPQDVNKLTQYAEIYPDKLSKIGWELERRVKKDLYKERFGEVRIGMLAVNSLLLSCHSGQASLSLYEHSVLALVSSLLNHQREDLILLACKALSLYASYQGEEDHFDFGKMEQLMEPLISICDFKSNKPTVLFKLRLAGMDCLANMVNCMEHPYFSRYLSSIVTAVLKNLQQPTVTDVAESRKLRDVSLEVLRRVAANTKDRKVVGSLLSPVLAHFDASGWYPESAAVECLKTITTATQSHSFSVFLYLLEHLKSLDTAANAVVVKTHVLRVMATILTSVGHVLALQQVLNLFFNEMNWYLNQIPSSYLQHSLSRSDSLHTAAQTIVIERGFDSHTSAPRLPLTETVIQPQASVINGALVYHSESATSTTSGDKFGAFQIAVFDCIEKYASKLTHPRDHLALLNFTCESTQAERTNKQNGNIILYERALRIYLGIILRLLKAFAPYYQEGLALSDTCRRCLLLLTFDTNLAVRHSALQVWHTFLSLKDRTTLSHPLTDIQHRNLHSMLYALLLSPDNSVAVFQQILRLYTDTLTTYRNRDVAQAVPALLKVQDVILAQAKAGTTSASHYATVMTVLVAYFMTLAKEFGLESLEEYVQDVKQQQKFMLSSLVSVVEQQDKISITETAASPMDTQPDKLQILFHPLTLSTLVSAIEKDPEAADRFAQSLCRPYEPLAPVPEEPSVSLQRSTSLDFGSRTSVDADTFSNMIDALADAEKDSDMEYKDERSVTFASTLEDVPLAASRISDRSFEDMMSTLSNQAREKKSRFDTIMHFLPTESTVSSAPHLEMTPQSSPVQFPEMSRISHHVRGLSVELRSKSPPPNVI
eukprot:GILK01005725.1.p1 GENE.GILK01005725.1~~GILK01005725.1.p1  ORF type:complete len:858 (-),score=158.51 GILK01005725.1:133-2706(-)